MNPALELAVGIIVAACFVMATAVADDMPTRDAAPVYRDSADVPASDPALTRPEEPGETSLNVRRERSGPDISPGSQRDSLVPIPEDENGMIDPQ